MLIGCEAKFRVERASGYEDMIPRELRIPRFVNAAKKFVNDKAFLVLFLG
jgi:hypothetical protein